MNTIDIQTVTTDAHTRLTAFLHHNQTHPTAAQLAVLRALHENMTQLASGQLSGRYAWALPVGAGKTQSIVHWIGAMYRKQTGFSVVVASSQVAALRDLKADLIKQGIPSSSIGILVHRDKELEAGEPVIADGNEYPIVLVTHARVHMGKDELTRYWHYHDQPRSLMLYDESLISAESVMVNVRAVTHAIDILRGELSRKSLTLSTMFQVFLRDSWMPFYQTVEALKVEVECFEHDHPGEPIPNELRYVNHDLPYQILSDYTADYSALKKAGDTFGPLLDFLSLCGSTVRIAQTHLDEVLLSFHMTVPAEIANIVILDASAPIRMLMNLDSSIKLAETLPSVQTLGIPLLSDMFDYRHSSIYRFSAGAGHDTMQKDKTNDKIRDAVKLLECIPAGEAVLFYIFKHKPSTDRKDLTSILRQALTRQGYNLKSDLICIETFGRETSLNCYSHCKHIILLGTPWQNLSAVIGTALGQLGKGMTHHLPDLTLKELAITEVAYRFHQAIGRTVVRRNGPDGRPQGASVYCFLRNDQWEGLYPALLKVLPGLKAPKRLLRKHFQKELVKDSLAERLEVYLCNSGQNLPKVRNVRSLSVTRIRRDLGIAPTQGKSLSRCLADFTAKHPSWKRVGRRLIYT